MVDTYVDTNLPYYPDARVAAALCGPCGQCAYVVKEGMAVLHKFCKAIAHSSCNAFGADVGRVLALPLLWAMYKSEVPGPGPASGSKNHFTITSSLSAKINAAWINAGEISDINPIEKVELQLQVLLHADQLFISPIRCVLIDDNVEGVVPAGACTAGTAPAGNAGGSEFLSRQVLVLQDHVQDLKSEIFTTLAEYKWYMQVINTNVRRIATQPITCNAMEISNVRTMPHLAS